MDFDFLPFLSEFDPPQQTEGTIDPLGMYAIADALGTKLAPGVRERQSHPRYLTLAAVGNLVCDGLDPDREPPPWLVFEWYAVGGLVRCGLARDRRARRRGPARGARRVTPRRANVAYHCRASHARRFRPGAS